MADDFERELEKGFEGMLRDTGGRESGEAPGMEEPEAESTPTALAPNLSGFSPGFNLFQSLLNNRQQSGSNSTTQPRPGASPEEMLHWLRGTFNSMVSNMETHMPHYQKMQIPQSVLPSYQPVQELGGTPGSPIRTRDMMNSVNQLFDFASEAFKSMDAIKESLDGAARSPPPAPTVPSAPSTSGVQLEPQPRERFLSSLVSFASDTSNGSSAASFMSNTLTRSFQHNEIFLRSGLRKLAIQLQSHPEDDPGYILLQSVFGLTVLHLYEVTWKKEYLELGVLVTSLAWSKVGNPMEMTHMLPTLARSWCYGQRLQAQDTGNGEKLSLPVDLLGGMYEITKGIESMPAKAKGFLHYELACCLYERYLLLEDLSNLDAAIQHFETICLGDDVSTDKRCYLGYAHLQRFLACGNLDDLDRALFEATKACSSLDSANPQANPLNPGSDADTTAGLHLLALCCEQKFHLQLDFVYLDQAINKCRGAMQLLKEENPLYIRCKSDLALLLLLRFQSTNDRADLSAAEEEILTAIVLELPERNSQVPLKVILGMVQVMLADSPVDMDNAIQILSKARKDYSGPRYIESRIEEYMSRAFLRRYHTITMSIEDVEDALEHARLAVNKAHEAAPRRPELDVDLGHVLIVMYSLDKDPSRCAEAISHFSSAAEAASGRPTIRFQAATEWANAAEECHNETLIDALEYGLKLLPTVAWVGNRMPVQYRMLSAQSSALASRAAAYAIEHGQLDKAVSYLEMGRNILWTQALQFRVGSKSPEDMWDVNENEYLARYMSQEMHDDAHEINKEQMGEVIDKLSPEFIETFRSLQGVLKTINTRMVELKGEETVKKDTEHLRVFKEDFRKVYKEASLHNAASRWQVLQQGLQSLSNALSPSDPSHLLGDEHLASLLEQGPVVILNAYKLRCDAVVLSRTAGGDAALRHIALPEMSGDDAHAWAESLREGIYMFETGDCTRPEYEDSILIPILQGLWRCMVHPIIESLRENGEMKERVWWYPTGALAFLPLHAAGPYENDEPGLPELLASSYIPTLHSLIRAAKAPLEPFRLLAMGQSATPGYSPLPGVEKEIAAIRERFEDGPRGLTVLMSEVATIHKVSKALPEHTWLHFACHAHQDEEYPFHSAFFLHDGPLKLSKLMRLDLTRVQFAMLSACLTSAGDAALPDECIHLAAGMQFSGVRSVIATMWTVADIVALRATRGVYHHLLHNLSGEPDPANAAKALQLALLDMKKSKVPLTYRVPLIHTGI